MKTVRDLWRYIDSHITNKVNDIWEECWAQIIPVLPNGEFGTPISSKDNTPNADPYELVSYMMQNTDLLPTDEFGFMVPGKLRDPETNEVVSISIIVAMVGGSEASFGLWRSDENKFEELPENGEADGMLVAALEALAMKREIDNGGLGEVGEKVREALELAKQGRELMEQAERMLEEAHELYKA